MLPMLLNAIAQAAETATETAAHEEGGANPWLIGAVVFVFLMVLLIGVVAFGGGRDHS